MLTTTQIEMVIQHMTNAFDVRIVSGTREVVELFLNQLGKVDPDFRKVFNMCLDKVLYLADKPTEERSIPIVAHECQHRVQASDAGAIWYLRYLAQPSFRCGAEVEALIAEMETCFQLELPFSIKKACEQLADYYLLSEVDIAVARKGLKAAEKVVLAGGVSTESGQEAVKAIGLALAQ